jgi:hypothetical protein
LLDAVDFCKANHPNVDLKVSRKAQEVYTPSQISLWFRQIMINLTDANKYRVVTLAALEIMTLAKSQGRHPSAAGPHQSY